MNIIEQKSPKGDLPTDFRFLSVTERSRKVMALERFEDGIHNVFESLIKRCGNITQIFLKRLEDAFEYVREHPNILEAHYVNVLET